MTERPPDVFIAPRFDAEFAERPLWLADIGARGGLKSNWQAARRHLRVIGFEPDPREHQRLASQLHASGSPDRVVGTALFSQRGPMPLYLTRDRGLSSVFEPDQAVISAFPDADRFAVVERANVEADTLDHALAASGISDLDFIKVDTQGSELPILEGAAGALRGTVLGIEAEVEFTPIYKGQPLFADLDAYLRRHGFLLFDVRGCYWKRTAGRQLGGPHGQLIWGDVLYLKGWQALRSMLDGRDRPDQRAKILRMLSIALLYGYADYARELVERTGDWWSADDRAAILTRLNRPTDVSHRIPAFPGRRRLAAGLRRLWHWVREPGDGWSVSDADLGNLP